LFADTAGSVVGAAHAGWRGLAAGVLEATVAALGQLGAKPAQLIVWLGPAIGPAHFEVGPEVREVFVGEGAESAFVAGRGDRYWANLARLAEQRLEKLGLAQIYACGECTVTDSERFFSYRREHRTGRHATLIWLE
jgi:polyphenol oxidase